jgi:rRNA maturation RNase YbeY
MGREKLIVRIAGLSALPKAARRAGLFQEVVRRAFAVERPKLRGEVAVIFTTRAKMLAINRQYLGHDYDTDVITFEHDAAPGVPEAETPLGDIFVSGWMAARQAKEQGHPVLREALTLTAHGALHLLGHDDHDPRRKALMFRRQAELAGGLDL